MLVQPGRKGGFCARNEVGLFGDSGKQLWTNCGQLLAAPAIPCTRPWLTREGSLSKFKFSIHLSVVCVPLCGRPIQYESIYFYLCSAKSHPETSRSSLSRNLLIVALLASMLDRCLCRLSVCHSLLPGQCQTARFPLKATSSHTHSCQLAAILQTRSPGQAIWLSRSLSSQPDCLSASARRSSLFPCLWVSSFVSSFWIKTFIQFSDSFFYVMNLAFHLPPVSASSLWP